LYRREEEKPKKKRRKYTQRDRCGLLLKAAARVGGGGMFLFAFNVYKKRTRIKLHNTINRIHTHTVEEQRTETSQWQNEAGNKIQLSAARRRNASIRVVV
jgi:hypothetical protein